MNNVLQKLRFGGCWVSYDANIDISSQFYSFFGSFLNSSKKLEQNTFFDIEVTMNSWSYWSSKFCV
jgi:hypothetical protein